VIFTSLRYVIFAFGDIDRYLPPSIFNCCVKQVSREAQISAQPNIAEGKYRETQRSKYHKAYISK
jgi:hypothetical protein